MELVALHQQKGWHIKSKYICVIYATIYSHNHSTSTVVSRISCLVVLKNLDKYSLVTDTNETAPVLSNVYIGVEVYYSL